MYSGELPRRDEADGGQAAPLRAAGRLLIVRPSLLFGAWRAAGFVGMAADALRLRRRASRASALPGRPVRRPHVSAAGLRRHPGVAHRWPAGRALQREERGRRRRLPVPVRRRLLHQEGGTGPGESLSRAAARGSRGSSETRSSASAGSSAPWAPQAGDARWSRTGRRPSASTSGRAQGAPGVLPADSRYSLRETERAEGGIL